MREPSESRDSLTGSLIKSTGQPVVSVAFFAQPDVTIPVHARVIGADGLALKLADDKGYPIRLNQRKPPVLLTPGKNELLYTITPVRISVPLRPGAWQTTIGFGMFND